MHNKIFILFGFYTCLITAATAAPIDAERAKQQLSDHAKQKVLQGGIDLDALVNNESNDLIIQYKIDVTNISMGQKRRNHLANEKKNIQAQFNRGNGIETLRDFNSLPSGLYRIQNRETLVALLNDPNVEGVYPNRMNQTAMTEGLSLINQAPVTASNFTGIGSSVAVLDTGVNYFHPDFACTAINTPSATCRVVYAFDSAPDDGSLDDDGHGSNVSSIVAHVAPKAKLIGIDVFRKTRLQNQWGNMAYDSDIIAAVNWVVNNAQTYNIKAINLSVGVLGKKYTSECADSSYTSAFANARAAGVIPVVASGNDAYADGVSSPACAQGAVRVGAVYDSNIGVGEAVACSDSSTAADQVTCFSNGGDLVTLLAPGAMVTAGGYTQGGTSQATPYVAGAIALLRGNNVNSAETIDETIDRLKQTGKEINDSRTGIVLPRIDLLAATAGLTLK